MRSARIDLIKEKTTMPTIVSSSEVRATMGHQEKVVRSIIRQNQELTAIDGKMAAEILSQFDDTIEAEITPIKERIKNRNNLLPKMMRYGTAFAKGAFSSTGIPLMYRIGKSSLRATFSFAKKAITLNPFA